MPLLEVIPLRGSAARMGSHFVAVRSISCRRRSIAWLYDLEEREASVSAGAGCGEADDESIENFTGRSDARGLIFHLCQKSVARGDGVLRQDIRGRVPCLATISCDDQSVGIVLIPRRHHIPIHFAV